MRDTDGVAGVGEGELEELVGDGRAGVAEPEEGVVGEDGGDVEEAGHEQRLVGEGREGRVAMDNGDALLQEDVAEVGEGADDGGQDRVVVERNLELEMSLNVFFSWEPAL